MKNYIFDLRSYHSTAWIQNEHTYLIFMLNFRVLYILNSPYLVYCLKAYHGSWHQHNKCDFTRDDEDQYPPHHHRGQFDLGHLKCSVTESDCCKVILSLQVARVHEEGTGHQIVLHNTQTTRLLPPTLKNKYWKFSFQKLKIKIPWIARIGIVF